MKSDTAAGALFTIDRASSITLEKLIPTLYNQNGWIGYSDDVRSFALNTSNGGAAGGWSVWIFRVDDKGVIHDLSPSMDRIEQDFSARHSCKTRGDNYEAIQWRSNTDLLISASVYGTSDCGSEMGHTEGYLLDITTGRIVRHYTAREMLNLPYVCTYHVWQSGDPNPR